MAVADPQPFTGRLTARLAVSSARQMWLVFVGLLVATLAYLMYKSRGNTFFYDEWGFIENRHHGLHAIIASYNQHIQVIQLSLDQLLFKTVGLSHYWVYKLCEVLAHLSCASLLFEYARRRLGAVTLILIVPFLVFGIGWQYVLWAANVGYVLSFTFGIAALLMLDRDDRRGDALACGLLVIGVLASEFALVFALGIAVELWLRDRNLKRAWVWLTPFLLYGIWWLKYHEPTQARNNLTAAPAFAADLAAAALGGLLALTIEWGRALLVGTAALLGFWFARGRALSPRALCLLIAACAFWLLVALGRAQLGEPDASRYIYSGAVLIMLFLAETFKDVRLGRAGFVVATLLALFSLAGNIHDLTASERVLRMQSQQLEAELGAVQLTQAFIPADYPIDPHFTPGMVPAGILPALHAIGSSPAATPAQTLRLPEPARTAADATLVGAGELQVGSGTGATPAGTTPTVERAVGGSTSPAGNGCARFAPAGIGAAFDLLLPSGGLLIHASPGPSVELRARRFATDYEGNPVTVIAGGRAMIIRTRTDASSLPWHVRLSPRQPVTVCALSGA